MPQIQSNQLHLKYNVLNPHSFKIEAGSNEQNECTTPLPKGQFTGSKLKMSPLSNTNKQKLPVVQKINFRSNTKEQTGKHLRDGIVNQGVFPPSLPSALHLGNADSSTIPQPRTRQQESSISAM